MINTITHFKDDYYFLNNFYPTNITLFSSELNRDLIFRSSEHAYMAAKSKDPSEWENFTLAGNLLTASQAKKAGRKLKLRSDWDEVKLGYMKTIVKAKFDQNPLIRNLLIQTYPRKLEEGNYWNDTYWGICKGKGENHLGKILMEIRDNYVSVLNK